MGIASHTVVDWYGNSSHCNNCNKSNTNTQTQSLVIMCYTTKHGPSIKCQNRKRTRFVLKIENFPERQKSVKSNVIKVDVGEEEASQWILELVPGTNQDTALSASLWRTDCLSTDLGVTMTLITAYSSLTSQGPAVTASSPVTRLTGSEEARLGIHVTSILTQAQENVPDTDTLTVECQLSVKNLRQTPNIPRQCSIPHLDPVISMESVFTPHSLKDLEDGEDGEAWSRRREKRLEFGSVEELHYLVRKPRKRMCWKVTRSVGRLLDGLEAGIEAGDNKDPYMLLQVLSR